MQFERECSVAPVHAHANVPCRRLRMYRFAGGADFVVELPLPSSISMPTRVMVSVGKADSIDTERVMARMNVSLTRFGQWHVGGCSVAMPPTLSSADVTSDIHVDLCVSHISQPRKRQQRRVQAC